MIPVRWVNIISRNLLESLACQSFEVEAGESIEDATLVLKLVETIIRTSQGWNSKNDDREAEIGKGEKRLTTRGMGSFVILLLEEHRLQLQ